MIINVCVLFVFTRKYIFERYSACSKEDRAAADPLGDGATLAELDSFPEWTRAAARREPADHASL